MGELERTLHHDRRVLVVCHKDMEAHIAGIPSKFTERAVAHWGALDGKNDWRDFDTVALYGLPYRPPEWAPNTFMAIQGVQDTDTLQSSTFKVIRKRSTEDEIEITPAMVEAGVSAVLRALAGAEIFAPMTEEEMAKRVFVAMANASPHARTALSGSRTRRRLGFPELPLNGDNPCLK